MVSMTLTPTTTSTKTKSVTTTMSKVPTLWTNLMVPRGLSTTLQTNMKGSKLKYTVKDMLNILMVLTVTLESPIGVMVLASKRV